MNVNSENLLESPVVGVFLSLSDFPSLSESFLLCTVAVTKSVKSFTSHGEGEVFKS